MTAPDPRVGEIEARLSKVTPGEWWTPSRVTPAEVFSGTGLGDDRCVAEEMIKPDAEFIAAAPADIAYLLAELRDREAALDELMYVANHKAADTMVGRWWAEVIRGPIIKHLGAEKAAKLGAAVAAAGGGGDL